MTENENILIMEDEPAIADTLVYALKSEGYRVTWCSTCGDAWETINNSDVDFVILDIGMPDGNGFDFCRDLRKISDIPVLFLTARHSEIDRVVGLEIGGDDYMVKPFSPRELTARVRAILRRSRPHNNVDSAENNSCGLTLDENRKSVFYNGQLLVLTRYEYRILKLLITHPGWVFSREQIMSSVWEEPDSSLDRTVDTHIKSIRAKLQKITPHSSPIVTHRGQGYSLKEEK